MRIRVVMMDCGSVSVPARVIVIGNAMHMERLCLRLQRADGQGDHSRETSAHVPSLWDTTTMRQRTRRLGRAIYRPLTIGNTKTSENDHRLAPLGSPVAT